MLLMLRMIGWHRIWGGDIGEQLLHFSLFNFHVHCMLKIMFKYVKYMTKCSIVHANICKILLWSYCYFIRCYGKALKIYPECSSLWHDLGVNYFHQSQAITKQDAPSLAEKSVQSLKKAISLEPTNHKHWTALGYVACQKGNWTLSQENLFSGFSTRQDSNRSAQLQRPARAARGLKKYGYIN